MNRIKFHVKKGDHVEVITGNYRGSTGKVLQVLPKKNRVLIEGVRMIKKHLRKSQDNPAGRDRRARRPDPHFERETARTHGAGGQESKAKAAKAKTKRRRRTEEESRLG